MRELLWLINHTVNEVKKETDNLIKWFYLKDCFRLKSLRLSSLQSELNGNYTMNKIKSMCVCAVSLAMSSSLRPYGL